MATPEALWLHIKSDEFSVSTPKRFRKVIRFYPADRLVLLEPEALVQGVFAGAARACPLRLESIPLQWPQFCIRYNNRFESRLMGFGCEVFHNGEELGNNTVTLQLDDTIICDPYLIRVVNPPDVFLQDLVENLGAQSDEED